MGFVLEASYCKSGLNSSRKCGSYHEKDITTTSRDTVTWYPYVQYLAFISIFLRNSEICGIARLLPYVKKSTENLISLNIKTPDILAQNARIVRNVFENHTLIGNFRTLLTAIDITNIKKQMLRNKWNIDIKHDAAKNLNQILGPKADPSELKDTCLHYQLHTKDNNCLEIIICTCEQQDYVWKYGHQNLILIDGTFGISKHKLLLFIIMIIDDNNKGVLVSFILFTPPRSNRLTSPGYDTTSVTFSSCAAMTDADIKERKPLTKITKKKESLECIYKAESMSENKKILEGEDLLSSWCLSGWINVAKALGIPLEKLFTMNNHLEGMNEYLKNNQLNWFQRNNRLLRADVLYIALVCEVIPNILTLRNLAINIEREKAE
ncbi:21806_t:CDS:2 [Cetraspora pellucida]|uniref:21806_t:CDS:1 n=1 Tax=Cetraspora pellucida TaxID=1433469 RepID=A0A9N9EJ77_9GLOM|nr:21806_t:CDS:2 [Cetraspora pellucida]